MGGAQKRGVTTRRPQPPTGLPDSLLRDGWWLARSPKPPADSATIIPFPRVRNGAAGRERVVIPFPTSASRNRTGS